MNNTVYNLDFSSILGEVSENCRKLIEKFDFRYRKLDEKERDAVILKVIERLNSKNLSFSGKERKDSWEKGWSENLKDFVGKGCDLKMLVPKYIKQDQSIRFSGDYVMPLDSDFEVNWYLVFRTWLFENYFKDASAIYEFGSGSGYNLPILAELFPDKELHGLDWSESSKIIVDKMAENYNWNMKGHVFDMFSPDEGLEIKEGGACLTMGGFEQLGENFMPFLEYLCRKNFKVCVHMEPLKELYDQNSLVDYLGLEFHKKRGYLGNFISALKDLESKGKINIIKIKKTGLGNLFHDGYCFCAWEPTKNG
ncbi:MAG: hypothetical protein A2365_00625 [Candidatus Nealsonbacteria bacterium RIFOXYB1_FULL_40_15]|uniref:Methyltransferase domain-containing protein n=2 Tax=Candidatus Nealsoniibacteriota TaxID=1817911 RepID=A0A1G2ESI2_9BACT|nr:MAG: hypothetical protein A2365_00625 [Candidatus Nealsonbacteria bacterium RIFOXYB1_FULL_40_15]OGZ28775.1 MAG: hypothetical protein A2427_01805 [Candidatus Nealsonbacteria bacterium RIFOXYC1_FULL_40_7]OGZ29053.1 MAG: hypothetical protein A2562_01055 [Candidatus Nealsonbacteria bacterium RIFOXYD1_FULL_39_11]